MDEKETNKDANLSEEKTNIEEAKINSEIRNIKDGDNQTHPASSSSKLDEAKEVISNLEKQKKEAKEAFQQLEIQRIELDALLAENALQGIARAGQAEEEKEEISNKDYAEKALTGDYNGKEKTE